MEAKPQASHRKRFAAAVCVGALAVLGGCAAADGPGARPLEAGEHPMLAGVPLPRGFQPVNERTVAFEGGGLRIARYEFVGDAGRSAVHGFFLDHMPPAGYTLEQRRDEGGVATLRFVGADEECQVRIGTRNFKTYFVIDVAPRSAATGVRPAPRR
jgi:hypothetical protein